MLTVQSEGSAISLLVVLGKSAVHIQRPGFLTLLGDDIDDAARGIAAVKGRSRTFHNLDALHIVHVQSGEIHIVHRLACQSLAIHQEENTLSAESGKVEMGLLIHGIRELHARQLLLKQILHIGGIEPGDILGADHSGLDRCILQELRGAGARNHHLGEVKLATDGIEIGLVSQGVTDTLLVYARHIVMGRHIIGAGKKRCASRKSRHIG